jgi:tetratricopeptide (TPR) repeat protein
MRIAIVIVMIVFSVPALPTTAQAPGYTVHGMVTAPAHLSAAELVRVRLDRFGLPIHEIFLRENRFDIWNVERGHYTMTVSGPDFETLQQEIDVPGDAPVIELRPKRSRVIAPTAAVPVWDLKVPNSARREFKTARKELGESKCAEAVEHLKKAVRIYEEYGDAHQTMGECYTRMEQMDAAEQEFKRSLELPHLPERHLTFGLFYMKEGKQALFRRQMQLYAEEVTKAR